MKIVIVGAGSFQFGPKIISDIILSPLLIDKLQSLVLMDINADNLSAVYNFARKYIIESHPKANINLVKKTDLESSLDSANFVIVAIEVDRYKYWSQDFHIPRSFGFRQVYAENGGPGGLFHALRNFSSMLEIAEKMQKYCPEAWLLNYTNPESKIIQLLSKVSKIKSIGLCHGVFMGLNAISRILKIPINVINYKACGLNHFGWFTSLTHKETGENLYTELQKNELSANLLANWDELALIRILFRTFGLWPYPGTNHCGEYIGWSQDFLAGSMVQYFHDPVLNNPWDENNPATFVYSMEADISKIPLFSESENQYKALYTSKNEDEIEQGNKQKLLLEEMRKESGIDDDANAHAEPIAVRIMEGLVSNQNTQIDTVNMVNNGALKGLPDTMVIEANAEIRSGEILFKQMDELPIAINEMVRLQGVINELLVESFIERCRKKLLQAVMLDPTTPSYNAAVNMINRMFCLQKEILPHMEW